MAFWLIIGGAALSAWALLSLLGGELSRQTENLRAQARHTRAARASAAAK